MFGKLWKTLKFFLILGVILICLPHSILPKQSDDIKKDDLEYYTNLNNSESRLSEYRDDEEALKLKLTQLALINSSRRKNNAGPVKLDILASRVANKISREAARNNFLGHYNLAGEKPYHRYAAAGGYDHVSENTFGEWSTASYTENPATITQLMKKGHTTFMEEKPPYDGHRKNIINKSHNFVGLGYCLSGKQFRYYEEFIDRSFEFGNIPTEATVNQEVSLKVRTAKNSYLYYLVAYREDFPLPLTPEEILRKGSYEDFTPVQYLKIPAWDLAKYRNGSEYAIPVTFATPGLYYIQIYEDSKEITGPGTVNTAGKTPFSGIVIKVHQ
jgi:uncharacterized protein YkwD